MKRTLIIAALALTTACDTLKLPDYADAGTTAAVIAQGGVEMNPILGAAGNGAAPAVSLVGKYAIREGGPYVGLTEGQSEVTANAAGWLGACNNAAVLLGAGFPQSLIPGAGCLLLSIRHDVNAGLLEEE